VWLDSATGKGRSILASDPVSVFRAKNHADPFGALAEQLAIHPRATAIGYFAYDLKNGLEHLPSNATDDLGLPDCWFGFYDHVTTLSLSDESLACDSNPTLSPAVQANFSRAQYIAAVRRAKEYIADGDIYQVNLSQRFQCEVDTTAPAVYLALRAANPASYCAYLDIGDAQLLSSSPECFLDIRGRHVTTRPIKGTRPRSSDPQELLVSPKDNAELLMIVDLERNDLGRVCEFGSVRVPELARVETYATVHHLVATVTGQLRPEVSHLDCLRACFPGGSITGAPKIRAMEIIDELEPHARGVYTGAIGYFAPDGTSQFNIAIRTIVQQGRRLTFHAGGGIVADSDPGAEYEETMAKAQGIFNALHQLQTRRHTNNI